MIGAKLFVLHVIIWLITPSTLLTRAEERLDYLKSGLNRTQEGLRLLPGIKLRLVDSAIIVHVNIRDLLRDAEVQSRKGKEKKNLLQRLGHMIMMTPLVLQVLSLPGAIASIKMSLLKSIMVAQLAIAIMIYNLIRSVQNTDVVVVHQPQHHQHYYHNYHQHADDEDGWFGR